MDILKPVLPENFKPVAVVVEAQSDEQRLPNLSEEVDHIKARFKNLDFDVLHLKNPSASEISSLFSKTNPIHDRLAVFHFAGHSDESGMKLPSLNGDENDTEQVFFRGLAGFLSRVSSLRLVFINGCRSHGFVDHYPKSNRRSDRNVGLIVSNSTISDQIAKDFSIDFYNEWTKSEESKVTVQDAFDHAKSSLESRGTPPDVVRSESPVGPQDTEFPWSIANNPKSALPNCYSAAFFAKLIGKESYVESREFSRWWIAAFGAALAIAMVSLWFAYFSSFSSPAFQASFGYGLTRHDVVERAPKKHKSNDHQFFIVEKDLPTKGAFIELFRVVVGVLAIWMSFLLLGPPFEFRHLTKSQLASLLVFWTVVLAGVLYYNLSMAPKGLATDWKDYDNQWLSTIVWDDESASPSLGGSELFDPKSNSYFCLDKTVWENAGKTWQGDLWKNRLREFELLLKSNPEDSSPGAIKSKKLTKELQGFYENEMYFYPYYAYCFYSMVLFGFVATLLFFCVTVHTFKTANLVLFLVRATKGSKSVSAFKNEQKKIVNESHRLLFIALRRYSIFLCMLMIFLDYEVSFGFLTLASKAKYLTLLAIGLIFLMGAALLGIAHWRLTEAFISNDLDLVPGLRRPNEIWEDGWVRGACWLIPIVLAHVWYMLGRTL